VAKLATIRTVAQNRKSWARGEERVVAAEESVMMVVKEGVGAAVERFAEAEMEAVGEKPGKVVVVADETHL
jgi:hypothetical protein